MLQVVSSHPAGLTERRKNQRLNIQINASIKLINGVVYQGRTANLSYKGALIQFDFPLDVRQGEYCVFTLLYNRGHFHSELKLTGKIIQRRSNCVALEFKSISENEYNKLVLLLAEHFPESDDLMAEMDNDILMTWVRSAC